MGRGALISLALGLGLSTISVADATPLSASRTETPTYSTDIQPIFNRRCIACHGCLGSPCNVKLDSFSGVDRGGLAENPYASRLSSAPRTDMDAAPNTAAWRARGFYPILSRGAVPEDNLSGSMLYQMVAAGMHHNGPGFSHAAAAQQRTQSYVSQCEATPASLSASLQSNPELGMPFGLPSISDSDFTTLKAWISGGSPGPDAAAVTAAEQPANPQAVANWEAFFNADDPRTRLVSRFIFQHVFLAKIVLTDSPGDQFRLVRSSTPPAQITVQPDGTSTVTPSPIGLIATDLPYDDPLTYANVGQFWYRLQKVTQPTVQKAHFLWELAPDDIAHLTTLFAINSGTGWDAAAEIDPPYGIENPFIQFAAIPAESRYRFILENAETLVGGITYGPVCNGQTATYAIKDQFWALFLEPAHDPSVHEPLLGFDDPEKLMDRSAIGNAAYLAAFAEAKNRLSPDGWALDAVWDGDGEDANAWLTILRHETNVSVLKGAQGGMPRTLWLISFAGFERMYYDTVAGFAYWGGDPAKLQTLAFFNLLRQDFEDHFLLLLPTQHRQPIRYDWTQGIGRLDLALIPFIGHDQPSRVTVEGTAPLDEIVSQLAERAGPHVTGLPDRLNPSTKPTVDLSAPMQGFDDFERAISTMTVLDQRPYLGLMPSVTVVRLTHGGKERVYSLVVNRAYASQYNLLFQDAAATPGRDTLSVYPTLVNGFPNLFVDLDLDSAPGFLSDLAAARNEDDWNRVTADYAVLRNTAQFWPFYDWLNDWNFTTRGDSAGWLDLTYYDTAQK
ncbi:fatty acid cis/trans isomerase [Pseudoruegeria sp. SK021]|uniref:fatty acid cis/trans isomerase n=1 Tax=Pseudoruegeria sp. SK021 TaxID=1933035 RepID=UPI00111C2E9D|nr:fatty acid cis/trans isomerase [Pseudoruegeria sp. SK021]